MTDPTEASPPTFDNWLRKVVRYTPLPIECPRPQPNGRGLPLYDRTDYPVMSIDPTRAHPPGRCPYTLVQMQCLPDARPEHAPLGFRYRPLGKDALLFEVTLLADQAVDAGYVVEMVDEDPIRLRALAAEARRVNHVNNWARDFTFDHLPARLELIHTEISEAYRAPELTDQMNELGDVIIRTLDLIKLLEDAGHPVEWQDLREDAFSIWLGDWPHLLLRMHDRTDRAMEVYRKVADPDGAVQEVMAELFTLVNLAWAGLLYTGVTAPMALLTDLVRQNATRGLTHGGRRL